MLSVYAQELQALKAELHHTLARLGDGSSTTVPSSTQATTAAALPFLVTPGVRSFSSSAARPSANSIANERSSGTRPPASAASWSVASTRTVSTAATTPEAPESAIASEQQQRVLQAPHGSTGTTWDARRLMGELRTASQRRRELEIELANEMEREQERVQQRQRDARVPWQNAIAALQRQRAEIVRQIEIESQRDLFAGGDIVESDASISCEGDGGDLSKTQQQNRMLYRDSSTQMSPLPQTPPVRPRRSQQATIAGFASDAASRYSIEGVVTLGPLQKNGSTSTHSTTATVSQREERVQHATTAASTGTATSNHHNPSPSLPPSVFKHDLYGRPESHHDALNEVFSIQLKFAETMLKLEKSVQIRDQLLQRNAASVSATRGHRSRRGLAETLARRANTATLGHNHSDHSGSESYYEDDMLSSEYDSFSSGASLGDYTARLRRYTSDNGDLEVHVPSTLSTDRRASATSTAAAASSSANPAAVDAPQTNHFSLSAVEEEAEGDGNGDGSSESPSSNEQQTPSTESSDKTSNSSTAKQVRFGDGGEYSTPLIARKFNFENQSDDEDDLESILSFMEGSSVTSSELNDVSLIKAFEMFRRELGILKATSPQQQQQLKSSSSGITAAISAARALFANDESDANGAQRGMLKPAKQKPATIAKQMLRDDEAAIPEKQDPAVAANAGVNTKHKPQQNQQEDPPTVEALSERRRQLCLDIQAESAQLVLTFGSHNAHQTERIKQNLIHLRSELRTVDEQLKL